MPIENVKPVILLAFANDRSDGSRYLRNLPEESRRVRAALRTAERDGKCEVVECPNATAGEVIDALQDDRYSGRVAVFHYGGHADGYRLLLESASGGPAAVRAGGLARLLGQQHGLRLVFLNGCSTAPQLQGLLEARVPAVVATSRSIDDSAATDFAARFYAELGAGGALRRAFAAARSAVEMVRGEATRDLFREGAAEAIDVPWSLHQAEGHERALDWSLAEAAGDPTFGLPPLPEYDLPDSPFRHLSWFAEKHADVFFGRGSQIRDLYERVTTPNAAPVILLYGQSGVGKSSVLAAGLLPRLKTSHQVRYVRRDPQKGLLNSIELPLLFEGRALWLGDSLRAIEEQCGKPLLLILDQLEEVFTKPLPERPSELLEFVEVLQKAFADPDQRPRSKLVLGFRKEWLSEVEHGLAEAGLPRAKVFLQRLDHRGIVEAVSGPARSDRLRRQYGLTVAEGLAETIAADLLEDNESAVAPTLQILLTKMWERATQSNRANPRFDRELYLQMKSEGFLLRDFLRQQLGALQAWRAEAVDTGLALDLLSYHTTPLGTAAERTEEELERAFGHVGDVMGLLVQQCKDLYLLADPADDQEEQARTTRLAHDTLAPLVREQSDNSDKPGQRARRILANRAGEWEGGQVGSPLDEVDLKLVEQGQLGTRAFTECERRLVHASRTKQSRRERARRWSRRLGMAAVGAVAASAVIAWVQGEYARVANSQLSQANTDLSRTNTKLDKTLKDEKQALDDEQTAREQAERRSWVSDAQRLATQSERAREQSPQQSVLLAAEAIRATTDHGEPPVPAAETALRLALQNIGGRPLVSPRGEFSEVVISPDSAWVCTGGSGGFDLWPLRGRNGAGVPTHVEGAVQRPEFSADGKRLLSTTGEGRVCLWELRAGEGITGPIIDAQRPSGVKSARFSPDGHWILATLTDNSLRLWDVHALGPETQSRPVHGRIDSGWFQAIGERPWALGGPESGDFSRDGRRLFYIGFDGAARLLRLDHATSELKPLLFPGFVTGFRDHSAVGDWLLTESVDGRIELWDLRAQDVLASAQTLDELGRARTFQFDPTGRWLLADMQNFRSYLWDLSSRRIPAQPHDLPGITRDRNSHKDQFSPDGGYLLSRGTRNSARLWKLMEAQPPGPVGNLELGRFDKLDFSADGRWLLAKPIVGLALDHRLNLWDLHQKTPLETPIPVSWAWGGAKALFSPDSRWLVFEDSSREIHLRHLAKNDPSSSHVIPRSYRLPSSSPWFSPDSRWLVTEMELSLALWDLWAADPTATPTLLRAHEAPIIKWKFSDNGTWLVTKSDDHSTRLWDLTQPENSFSRLALSKPIKRDSPGLRLTTRDPVPVSADGKRVAVPQADGSVLICNLDEDEPRASAVRVPSDGKLVSTMSFSPDGQWLVIDSGNGTPRLVKTLATIQPAVPVSILGEKQQVDDSAFTFAGGHLVTADDQGAIHVWTLEPGRTVPHKKVLNGHRGRIYELNVSPDSRWLVSRSVGIVNGGRSSVQTYMTLLWRLADGWLSPFRIPNELGQVAFSRDKKWLAICTLEQIFLWNITGSEPRQVVPQEIKRIANPRRQMSGVRFSDDSRWLVADRSQDPPSLWDLSTENVEQSLIVPADPPGHRECDNYFSPDSRWMLMTHDGENGTTLFNLKAGEVVKSASFLTGHREQKPSVVSFSSDYHWLATGDDDGLVILWNLKSATPTESYRVLERETEKITNLRFNRDSRRLLIATDKLGSRLRGIVDGQAQEESVGLGRPTSRTARFVDSGSREWLLSVDADAVRLWPVDTQALMRIAALAVSRNLTQEEWRQYQFHGPYRRTVSTRPTGPARVRPPSIFGRSARGATPFLVEHGQELARKGDIPGATAAFRQALEEDPGLDLHPERTARQLAGKTFLAQGDDSARLSGVAKAVERYQAAQKADPALHLTPEPRARSLRAGFLIERAEWQGWHGRLTDAIKCLTEAKELQPDLPMNVPELRKKWAAFARGRELVSQGDVANASQAFREVLEAAHIPDLEPAEFAKRLAIASLLDRADRSAATRDVAAAADFYRRAQRIEPILRFDPDQKARVVAAGLLVDAGNELLDRDKSLEALAKYRSAFALDPDAPAFTAALNSAARNACLSGHATDALFASEQAVAHDPDNGDFRDTRGLAKALTGRFAEAVKDFEAFIASSKDEKAKEQRRAWCDSLRSGKNPFTPALLLELRLDQQR